MKGLFAVEIDAVLLVVLLYILMRDAVAGLHELSSSLKSIRTHVAPVLFLYEWNVEKAVSTLLDLQGRRTQRTCTSFSLERWGI